MHNEPYVSDLFKNTHTKQVGSRPQFEYTRYLTFQNLKYDKKIIYDDETIGSNDSIMQSFKFLIELFE